MKKIITLCLVVLAAQIGLTVWTHWPKPEEGQSVSNGPLLRFNPGSINEILVEDAAGHSLSVKKVQQQWVLPGQGDFPADSSRIQTLLERLAAMQRGWPEASTTEAAVRFRVAAGQFEHRLTLRQDGTDQSKVYFGTSPGLRKLYLRVDGDREILAMALTPQDLDSQPDNWIDTKVLHVDPAKIKRLVLPAVTLVKQDNGLQPEGLGEQEEVVKEQRDSLVKTAAGLTVRGLLGQERKPAYGLDKPILRYSIELEDGTNLEYVVDREAEPQEKTPAGAAAQPEEAMTILQASGQPQLLQVEGWQIDALLKASRASLLRTKTAATPAAHEGQPLEPVPAIKPVQ